jgi:PAS domain S-box-containing protein
MRWSHKTKEELILEIRHLKKELHVLESNEKVHSVAGNTVFDLRKTVDSMNLFGMILEEDGTIVFCNSYATKLLGYTSEELVGENFFEFLVPEGERNARILAFGTAMENGGVFDQKKEQCLPKMGKCVMELNSVIFNDFDEVKYLTIIGEDITERKKVAEALSRSNSQLQDLVNNTSD